MKKITLLTALFMAVISYGQTSTTHLQNGGFDTAVTNYSTDNANVSNWKSRIIKKGSDPAAPTVNNFETQNTVAVSGNALHLNILDRQTVGKPNVRFEMQPGAPIIAPEPTTVVTSGAFYFTIKFKMRFSGAIDGNLQIQSKFRQGDNSTEVIPTHWYVSAGGVLNDGVGVATGKMDIDATGLALDTWHNVLIDIEFPDVTLVKRQNTLWFSMGTIPEGVDFYIDDISQEFSGGGSPLSTKDFAKEDPNVFIYPNPANNVLNYRADNVSTVEVYNLVGQKVLQENGSGKMDVSSLSKGMYILRLMGDNDAVSSKRFIKD